MRNLPFVRPLSACLDVSSARSTSGFSHDSVGAEVLVARAIEEDVSSARGCITILYSGTKADSVEDCVDTGTGGGMSVGREQGAKRRKKK
jgi:hypothetical protein